MRWWQPFVVLLDLYLLASVTPWLAVIALSWSLRHSYRSIARVTGYLDKLQQGLAEQSAWWPAQPRFGPYAPPVQQAEALLPLLAAQLTAAERLAQPLRSATLPECSVRHVLIMRCWAYLGNMYSIWSVVRRLANSLVEIVPNMDGLAEARRIVEGIPSDIHAQLDLRHYELGQFDVRLSAELDCGTTGLDLLQAKSRTLVKEIARLQARMPLDADTGPYTSDAISESIATISTDLAEMSQVLTQKTQERQQAEASLDQMVSLAAFLRDRWHAVQRQGLHNQSIDERLIELRSQLENAHAKLLQHSSEAYQWIITTGGGFSECAKVLTDEMAGYEKDIAQADATLNAAADDLTNGKEAIAHLHTQFMNVNADESGEILDLASELLASASGHRQLGTPEGVQHTIELAQQARQQAAAAQDNIAGLEGRVREVLALWIDLKRGDTSSWRKQAQFLLGKLQDYPKHFAMAAELVRNIELSQREADLALGCLPDELVKGAYFKESQLENARDALIYAQRCLQYVSEGIAQARAALEHIEQQRLQLEQDVAMLLYVDLPGMEQLMGIMLPELRERFIQTALSIRQEAANLLDPAKTDYDEALRYGIPFLHRQLDEVRAAHATHVKQLQLQYEAEKGQLARSWGQLEHAEPAQFQHMACAYQQLQNEYRAWQQAAEGNQQNPLVLSQTLGRRSRDLQQRIVEMHRGIVEGRLALRELEKAFQQRYAQAEAMRTHVEQLGKTSSWPHLKWESETDRAWVLIAEGQRRIEMADSLPTLLDAWQRALSACSETVKLYERYDNQMREALSHLQDEFKAVAALRQRVQRQAEELSARSKHAESRKLTKLVDQVESCINLSKGEANFDAALRHLRQARDMLNRL